MPFSQRNYSDEQIFSIRHSISENRFHTYLEHANDDARYALSLYVYNIKLASSFMFSLNIVEIMLRNSIDIALEKECGYDWYISPYIKDLLTKKSFRKLCIAREHADKKTNCYNYHGEVISNLPFEFWAYFLNCDYTNFWRKYLGVVFPNKGEIKRSKISVMLKKIIRLRNRIAHHEPIFKNDVNNDYSNILRFINLICHDTYEFVKNESEIASITRNHPKKIVPASAQYD